MWPALYHRLLRRHSSIKQQLIFGSEVNPYHSTEDQCKDHNVSCFVPATTFTLTPRAQREEPPASTAPPGIKQPRSSSVATFFCLSLDTLPAPQSLRRDSRSRFLIAVSVEIDLAWLALAIGAEDYWNWLRQGGRKDPTRPDPLLWTTEAFWWRGRPMMWLELSRTARQQGLIALGLGARTTRRSRWKPITLFGRWTRSVWTKLWGGSNRVVNFPW